MKIFITSSSECNTDGMKKFASLLSSPKLGNHEVTYHDIIPALNSKESFENWAKKHLQEIIKADKVVVMRQEEVYSARDIYRQVEASYEVAFARYLGKEVIYFDVTYGSNLVLDNLAYLVGLEKEN